MNDELEPRLIDIAPEKIVLILNSEMTVTRDRSSSSSILDSEYLTAQQLRGFDKYKYNCIDTSPLSVYISHPFWNWLVQFFPRWWAPNVITLLGWGLVMGCFLLECVFDYDLDRNSVGTKDPVPNWFWLAAAVCTFLGHTLDGTDGKQARRIGASGPTGELFDHGLDSWSTVPFTITIFSVFGRGEFSVPPFNLLCVLLSVQVVFIVTHWEKYNTGVMFLSWAYDASQYGLVAVYLFTYLVGYQWFKFYVYGAVTFATAFEFGFYLCCIGSLAMSVYNMWESYAVQKTFKQPSLAEACRPLFPILALFFVCLYWARLSPTDVIGRDPRMFFFAVGTVFSNIACRLIIAQMSSSRAEAFNALLLLYTVTAVSSFLFPQWELAFLRLATGAIVFAHMHYGVCVVRQLCDHFKIHALDVQYLEKKN